MKFGNWSITEAGIEWTADDLRRFFINKEDLTETLKPGNSGEELYKWIILAIEEDWLTHDDLYDLNFAFVYAIAQARLNFDYHLFDQTLAYQFEVLEEEESMQPSPGISAEETAEAEQQRKDALSERD